MAYGTVNADLITTSAAQSLGAGNATNFKNRIINGAMMIDQRNAGASVSASSANAVTYTLDRWFYYATQASKFTVQQNAAAVTPPAGFINYLGVTSSSAYSVGAGDLFIISQRIEGLNTADLAWGTANAKTVTLSFQVYSSLTGTFGGAVKNSAGNRSYPFTYTISSANTWTSISVTIAGDTSGTWLTTNGIGIDLNFGLGVGSSTSAAAGAWAAGNYVSATGATSVVGTNGATWYMTGVQLEVGSAASSFEVRDYGRELILCQRYYYKQNSSTNYQRFGIGFVGAGSSTNFYANIINPVTMRAAPTSIDWTPSIGVWNGGALSAATAFAFDAATQMGSSLLVTSSGLTAQQPYMLMGNASSAASLALSAEL